MAERKYRKKSIFRVAVHKFTIPPGSQVRGVTERWLTTEDGKWVADHMHPVLGAYASHSSYTTFYIYAHFSGLNTTAAILKFKDITLTTSS